MPVVPVYNLERKQVGTLDLSDAIFGAEVKEHLFHEVVRAQLAAKRQGTHATKERSEVIGSVKKIFKQKGTGRARHGSRKAPNFVGGGTVFGPHPRDYTFKVNKKVRAAALVSALSRRTEEGRLVVVDDLNLPKIQTKQVVQIQGRFEAPKALFVDVDNANLALSARNIPTAQYLAVGGINVYDVLRHDTLVISKAAALALQERIG
ncbi:MAG: 50S ribosomal protein L4 [Deltaproteobacteria bacterium]|nr:50S ribosomal protein L4 [Deltaproteobacteria bacterium]